MLVSSHTLQTEFVLVVTGNKWPIWRKWRQTHFCLYCFDTNRKCWKATLGKIVNSAYSEPSKPRLRGPPTPSCPPETPRPPLLPFAAPLATTKVSASTKKERKRNTIKCVNTDSFSNAELNQLLILKQITLWNIIWITFVTDAHAFCQNKQTHMLICILAFYFVLCWCFFPFEVLRASERESAAAVVVPWRRRAARSSAGTPPSSRRCSLLHWRLRREQTHTIITQHNKRQSDKRFSKENSERK